MPRVVRGRQHTFPNITVADVLKAMDAMFIDFLMPVEPFKPADTPLSFGNVKKAVEELDKKDPSRVRGLSVGYITPNPTFSDPDMVKIDKDTPELFGVEVREVNFMNPRAAYMLTPGHFDPKSIVKISWD